MKLKLNKKSIKFLSLKNSVLAIGDTPQVAGGAGQKTGNTACCSEESIQIQCGPSIPIILTAYTACDCPTAVNICGPN